jgi:hypothetical protein
MLMRCDGISVASLVINALGRLVPALCSFLGNDAFHDFLQSLISQVCYSELKLGIYALFRSVAEGFYSSLSAVTIELVEASAADLPVADSDLLLALTSLWNTIAQVELGRAEVSHQIVFTAAPYLTPLLIGQFVSARERTEPTGEGEWDIDAAVRVCLENFARLAFPTVSEFLEHVLLSIQNPEINLELCDILWTAGSAEYRNEFGPQTVAMASDYLGDSRARVRAAALRLLNSLFESPCLAAPDLLPSITSVLWDDPTIAKLAVHALVKIVAAMPESECHLVVFEWLRSFQVLPPSLASELFFEIADRILKHRDENPNREFYGEIVRMLTEILELLGRERHSEVLIEGVTYALVSALSFVKSSLADIAAQFWAAVELCWNRAHYCLILILIHSFAMVDRESFASFAEPAFLFVRERIEHPENELIFKTAMMTLTSFPCAGISRLLEPCAEIVADVCAPDMDSGAFLYVLDMCWFMLWEPVMVVDRFWNCVLDRIHAFAQAIHTEFENDKVTCLRLIRDTREFIDDFCSSGPLTFREAAGNIRREIDAAVSYLALPET